MMWRVGALLLSILGQEVRIVTSSHVLAPAP